MVFETLVVGKNFVFTNKNLHGSEVYTKVSDINYRKTKAGPQACCLSVSGLPEGKFEIVVPF